MSFITSQQANIQGCKIETPHSQDIRDICGTSMCAGASNLFDGTTWTTPAGWTDNGDGSYTFANTGAISIMTNNVVLEAGKNYRFTWTMTEQTGTGISSRCSGVNGVAVTTPGTFVDDYAAVTGSGTTGIRAFGGTTSATVSNLILQEY